MTMGMHLLVKAYLCKYFAAAWFIIRLAAFFVPLVPFVYLWLLLAISALHINVLLFICNNICGLRMK
jgi:hypothetical protein